MENCVEEHLQKLNHRTPPLMLQNKHRKSCQNKFWRNPGKQVLLQRKKYIHLKKMLFTKFAKEYASKLQN